MYIYICTNRFLYIYIYMCVYPSRVLSPTPSVQLWNSPFEVHLSTLRLHSSEIPPASSSWGWWWSSIKNSQEKDSCFVTGFTNVDVFLQFFYILLLFLGRKSVTSKNLQEHLSGSIEVKSCWWVQCKMLTPGQCQVLLCFTVGGFPGTFL